MPKKSFFLLALTPILILGGLSLASQVWAEGEEIVGEIATVTDFLVVPEPKTLEPVTIEVPTIEPATTTESVEDLENSTTTDPLVEILEDFSFPALPTTTDSVDTILEPEIIEPLVIATSTEATSTEATSTVKVAEMPAENIAPVGEIIYPTSDMSVSGLVTIKVRITDTGSGLANILFYLSDNNGTFLGETNQPDADGFYSVVWDVSNTQFSKYGPHYVYTAILGTGGEASNSVFVPVTIGSVSSSPHQNFLGAFLYPVVSAIFSKIISVFNFV